MAIKCSANATNGHIGKYAGVVAKVGGAYTAYPFAYSGHSFTVNTAKGAVMPKPGSVQGIVVGMVQANPGLTGAALLGAMLAHNWQGFAGKTGHVNPTTGKVSAPWCVGYIAGLVARGKNQHLALVATLAATPAQAAPQAAPQAPKAQAATPTKGKV